MRFPQSAFEGPHGCCCSVLESQGIRFREILIDRSLPHEGRDTRKPGVGMVRHYLADDGWSRAASAMVGDRETDLQFAANLGVRGLRVGAQGISWAEVAHGLCDAPRIARVERVTRETRITVRVDLDAPLPPRVRTGLGFFDHMLEQLGKHGGFALELECARRSRRSTSTIPSRTARWHWARRCARRWATSAASAATAMPRSRLARPIPRRRRSRGRRRSACGCRWTRAGSARCWICPDGRISSSTGTFPRERVGDLPTELVPHFFRSLCDSLGANLHLEVHGENAHHMVEGCFKAVARALRAALRREGDVLPSTKGML